MSEIHDRLIVIGQKMEQPQGSTTDDVEALSKVFYDEHNQKEKGFNNNGGHFQRVAEDKIQKLYIQLAMKDGQIMELRNMLCLAQKATIETNVAFEMVRQGRNKNINVISKNDEGTSEDYISWKNHHQMNREASCDAESVNAQVQEIREKYINLINGKEAEENNDKERRTELASLREKLSDFEKTFHESKESTCDQGKMTKELEVENLQLRSDPLSAEESHKFELIKSAKEEGCDSKVKFNTYNSLNNEVSKRLDTLVEENKSLKKRVTEVISELDIAKGQFMKNQFLQVELQELEELYDTLKRVLESRQNKNQHLSPKKEEPKAKSKEKNRKECNYATVVKDNDDNTALEESLSLEKDRKQTKKLLEKTNYLEEENSVLKEQGRQSSVVESSSVQHLLTKGLTTTLDMSDEAEATYTKVAHQNTKNDDLQEENRSLKEELKELQHTQHDFNLALSEMQEDKSSLERSNEQLRKEAVEMRRKNSEIKSALILANIEKVDLEEKVEVLEEQGSKEQKLQERIQELLTEVDMARGQIMKKEFLEVEVNELTEKCASLQQALHESESKQQNTEMKLINSQAQLQKSSEEQQTSKLQELDKENVSLKEEVKELEHIQHDFNLALSEMQEDKSSLERANQQLRKEAVEMRRKNSEIKSALILANIEKVDLEEKVEVLEEQESKEQKLQESKEQKLQERIQELLSEVDIGRGQIMKKEFLEVEVNELTEKCASLQQALHESESKQQNTEMKLIDSQAQLQKISEEQQASKLQELDEKNVSLKEELKELQHTQHDFNLALSEMQEDKSELERANEQLRKEAVEMRRKNSEIKSALILANIAKVDLEEKVEVLEEQESTEQNLQERIQELLTEVDMARRQIMKKEFLEAEVNELTDKCASLQQALHESESKQQSTEIKLIDLQAQIQKPSGDKQTSEIEELQEENRLLKKETKELSRAQNEFNQIHCQLEEDKSNLERTNDQLRNELLQMRAINSRIETALSTSNHDKNESEEKIEIMAEELSKTKASLKTNKISMIKLNAQVDDLKKNKEDIERNNHSLQIQYDALRKTTSDQLIFAKENHISMKEIEERETYIKQLENSLQENSKLCSQLKAEAKQTTVRLNQMEKERIEVENDVEFINQEREKWSKKYREASVAAVQAEERIKFLLSQLHLMTTVEMPMEEQNDMAVVKSIKNHLFEKDSKIYKLEAANREMQNELKALKDAVKIETSQYMLKDDARLYQADNVDQHHQLLEKDPEIESEIFNDECDVLKTKIQQMLKKNQILEGEIEKVCSQRSQHKKALQGVAHYTEEAKIDSTSGAITRQKTTACYDEECIVVGDEGIKVQDRKTPESSLYDVPENTENDFSASKEKDYRVRRNNDVDIVLSFWRNNQVEEFKETVNKAKSPSIEANNIITKRGNIFVKNQTEVKQFQSEIKKGGSCQSNGGAEDVVFFDGILQMKIPPLKETQSSQF